MGLATNKECSDWYKDAVIYQLHVKSFCDSNNDGIGDFKGLTQKLPYLKSLGVTAIWILPFYPSPLKDDGYDISDYYEVNPQYGTLRDFKDFLKTAHQLDLKVITELVINHSSDQHAWFQRARKSKPGSRYRDYYVWSDSADKYKDARIIFRDFENSNWTWDEEAGAYYWHRFYSHQPDLNFDNPSVVREIIKVLDFWFMLGVDGMRLDAVPYLFERDGTNCENLDETHALLRKLRKHLDSKFNNKMLLAEANQWPQDACAYFGQGDGDECHMAFHFPLMPRMYMSIQMEDSFPIVDILKQTPKIPENCQWAIFLRNHDELTLEMVTDDERDYMYRSYAQDSRSRINQGIRRRLVPLLGNDRKKIELMNILLFCLPGTPVIYYGDEIGMGDNRFLGDRDGVRTPMQWSPDRNAGFSKSNSQELYLPVVIDSQYHYETVNVEIQESNVSSLLCWMKRVVAMRRRFKSFSRGDIKFISSENPKILSFIRSYEDENILVVINLSRFAQVVELDLSQYSGFLPEEVFSYNNFPVISEKPYVLTLSSHSHFWFTLKNKENPEAVLAETRNYKLNLDQSWLEVFSTDNVEHFELHILSSYIKKCRWYAAKSRQIIALKVEDRIPYADTASKGMLLILKVSYREGEPQRYVLPISFAFFSEGTEILHKINDDIICEISINNNDGFLYDGVFDCAFHEFLINRIIAKKKYQTEIATLGSQSRRGLTTALEKLKQESDSRVFDADHSNTAIVYGDKFFLKLFRKIEFGLNPDVEISQFFEQSNSTVRVAKFAGSINYQRASSKVADLALMQDMVNSERTAWDYILEELKVYFDYMMLSGSNTTEIRKNFRLEGFFAQMIRRIGECTAKMHVELASAHNNEAFIPEAFSLLYQKSVCQSMGTQARYNLDLLEKNISKLAKVHQKDARDVLSSYAKIHESFDLLTQVKISAKKIRIHGDYHLGQMIFTGKDFVILDFEGEPARSLGERRLKRSALRDVAGMLRSLHYAAYVSLMRERNVESSQLGFMQKLAEIWYEQASVLFVNSYFANVQEESFLPKSTKQCTMLLNLYTLDKAIYELGYELNNRPDWVLIPLVGIKQIIKDIKS